ncbi:MAG: iron chelate uptake ABC transporter family permease subunit, partial [Candidatus Omnitrophica bacterium]|nr:iron chelate uptake ABC transporter family permease subunit [Candidatus Omnitrophota bacterium]
MSKVMRIDRICNTSRKKARGIIILLGLFLAISSILYIRIGQVELSKKIFIIRLARTLLGITAGVGLATCGAVFQAVLRNPLAEPYMLG